MPIRASSSRDITRLIADLAASDGVRRESAIARLAVIGPRAVERLTHVATGENALAAAAALRALERIAEPRATAAILPLLHHRDPDVATAALAVARAHVLAGDGSAPAALDAIVATAVDTRRPDRLRTRAIEALNDLPHLEIAPLLRQLANDPNEVVQAHVTRLTGGSVSPAELLERAANGELPDGGEEVKTWLQCAGATMPVSVLDRLVRSLRARADAETDAGRRAEWNAARGEVHHRLAERGSRVALYDLRETLERAEGPVPLSVGAAVAKNGDASCLEALAAAYRRSAQSGEESCRRVLAAAFTEIVRREGLTRRHGVLKKLEARWPGVLREIMM